MKKKIYSLEFKESSAKLAAESDQSVAKTAKDLGINENTLHGWMSKYLKPADKQKVPDNLYEENKRLRKENALLKQERDILKKATAYFAKEIQ